MKPLFLQQDLEIEAFDKITDLCGGRDDTAHMIADKFLLLLMNVYNTTIIAIDWRFHGYFHSQK